MRTGLLCLILFTTVAIAQTNRSVAIVRRLNEHLIPLKGLSADISPEKTLIMRRFSDEMFMLYQTTVIPEGLAYSLTSALAGKKLTQENLTPLTRSTIAALNAASDCRGTRCSHWT